jgi:hypothetical protein
MCGINARVIGGIRDLHGVTFEIRCEIDQPSVFPTEGAQRISIEAESDAVGIAGLRACGLGEQGRGGHGFEECAAMHAAFVA